MDWSQSEEQAEVLEYCVILKKFLFDNLWEEEILITAYPVAHVSQQNPVSPNVRPRRFTTLNNFLPTLNID